MNRSPLSFSRPPSSLLMWALVLLLSMLSFGMHLARASAHRSDEPCLPLRLAAAPTSPTSASI